MVVLFAVFVPVFLTALVIAVFVLPVFLTALTTGFFATGFLASLASGFGLSKDFLEFLPKKAFLAKQR